MTLRRTTVFWLTALLLPTVFLLLAIAILPEELRAIYQQNFADARLERLFLSTVSFFMTFAIARLVAYAVHQAQTSFRGIYIAGKHVHHLVFGILFLLLVGYLWLLPIGTGINGSSRWLSRVTAALYGCGAALTLDEFALWLNLAGVYWLREGRKSIDAIIFFGTVLNLSLWGGPFLSAVFRSVLKLLSL